MVVQITKHREPASGKLAGPSFARLAFRTRRRLTNSHSQNHASSTVVPAAHTCSAGYSKPADLPACCWKKAVPWMTASTAEFRIAATAWCTAKRKTDPVVHTDWAMRIRASLWPDTPEAWLDWVYVTRHYTDLAVWRSELGVGNLEDALP